MASLPPPQKFRAFTAGNAGAPVRPLVGGKLYTYEAGTTTPKVTYTDATETTPNTNPVILNSRGEADVWLGLGTYKFVLTDSTGVTESVTDGIKSAGQWLEEAESAAEGVDSSIRNDLANSATTTKGAGMVAYNRAVDYPAGTVGAKLRETVSVKEFGAKGDGTTDDTAAIQAAINFISPTTYNATTGGGTVIFPPGKYRITSGLLVAGGTRLLGTGNGGFPYDGTNSKHSIILADFAGNVNQWVIDSATYNKPAGNRLAYNAFVGADLNVSFTASYQIGIEGLHIRAVDQTTNIVWGGIRLVGCPDAEVRNCTVLGTGIAFQTNTSFTSRWSGLHSETHFYGFVAYESNNAFSVEGYFNKIVTPASLSVPTERVLSIIPDAATLISYGLPNVHTNTAKGLIIAAQVGSSSQVAHVSVTLEYWPDTVFLLRAYSTVFSKLYCESTDIDYVVTGAYCSAVGEALSAFAANAKGFDIGFDCRLDMTVQGLFAVDEVLGVVNDDANVANGASLILRGLTSYGGQIQDGRVAWENDARPLAYISFDGASLAIKNAYNMVAVSRVPGEPTGDYWVDFRRPSNATALQGEVVPSVTLSGGGFGYVQLGGGDGIQNNRIRVRCETAAGAVFNPSRVMVTIFG